jgi:acyl dehydratase
MRYLEDFTPGEVIELGSKTVSEEEILTFAREFDPQPFHVDPERARDSIYGGIIASGWHTIAIFMRLAVDGFFNDTISMGSPGVNEVRWLRPVRPGDTLRARLTMIELTPSRSHPDRGTMRSLAEVFNGQDERVLSMDVLGIVGRRPQ